MSNLSNIHIRVALCRVCWTSPSCVQKRIRTTLAFCETLTEGELCVLFACWAKKNHEGCRVPVPVPIEREMFVECFSYQVAAMIYRESPWDIFAEDECIFSKISSSSVGGFDFSVHNLETVTCIIFQCHSFFCLFLVKKLQYTFLTKPPHSNVGGVEVPPCHVLSPLSFTFLGKLPRQFGWFANPAIMRRKAGKRLFFGMMDDRSSGWSWANEGW